MVCPNRTTPRQFSGNVTSGSIIEFDSWMSIEDARTAAACSFITARFEIPGVITSKSHQCCHRTRCRPANELPIRSVLVIF